MEINKTCGVPRGAKLTEKSSGNKYTVNNRRWKNGTMVFEIQVSDTVNGAKREITLIELSQNFEWTSW